MDETVGASVSTPEQSAAWLDQQVRRLDPDRWLTSRFVGDPHRRTDLLALYALEAELAAIPSRVSQPLLAEMRFTWWADQLEGVFAGNPRKGHPLLEALAPVVGDFALPQGPFERMIEAHIAAVHGAEPDMEALYVQPMHMATHILLGHAPDDELSGGISLAGRMFGLTRQGRRCEALGLRDGANRSLRPLPVRAFPAVLPARELPAGQSELARRLALTWTCLRGRL
jgi:Phytoene/squalene synthetase